MWEMEMEMEMEMDLGGKGARLKHTSFFLTGVVELGS